MSVTKESLKLAIDNSAATLLHLSNKIKEVVFPKPIELTIEMSKLNDKYISEILKNVPAGHSKEYKETDFVYVFEIQNANFELMKRIFDRLCSSREIQNSEEFDEKKDICRPIHPESVYLYVGRSQKLRSRLKQHLDAGNKGIYAMHMLRWCPGIEATIKIYCYRFDKQPDLIVQALENGLWDSFQPIFGRKGER